MQSEKVEDNHSRQAKFKNEEKEEEKVLPGTIMDKKILRMMKMMGYQSGLGLGKHKQGITEHITVETQFQRSGFGLKLEELPQWDFTTDDVTPVEKVEWLENTSDFTHDLSTMLAWCKEERPLLDINKEYNFCDKEVLEAVISAKNIFDELDAKELCQARARANPFETIRSVFFMNRAALKMANIDAVTDFMFTNVDKDNYFTHSPHYFADVCAGPGGFTEYVLWRKKWFFKGFGFTLKGENDFKLGDSGCASPVTFVPLYGAKNDGDVCCPENITDFKEKVLFETGSEGVHFMMSDGGFSVEGHEDLQEILSKNIYICQCFMALEILRKHGHFVTKLFDIFTCFSVGLLYLMHKSFEKVCILKPNSSRPANSERYLICKNYKGRNKIKVIRSYLKKLVNKLWTLKNNSCLDVIEIVPFSVLKNDEKFFSYIYESNNRIAKNQTINLNKLAVFCKNPSLVEQRQDDLRKKCLQYWKVPDKMKVPLSKYSLDVLLSETVHNSELLLLQPREIYNPEDLDNILENVNDWRYVLLQCKNTSSCNFFAGIGTSKVYKLQNSKWVKVKNIQLARGTLLYGELVKEKIISNDGEMQKYSLHVIDALRLGDLNLADLDFSKRNELIGVYCKSVNQEFKFNTVRIRPKPIQKLSCIYQNLEIEGVCKGLISPLSALGFKSCQEIYEVGSILLLKTSKDQSFHSTFLLRLQWFLSDIEQESHDCLSLRILLDFVKNKKH